jgi:hypothetical protein
VPGGSGSDGPPDPLAIPPPLSAGNQQSRPAPRIVGLVGNRDWVIPIECVADGVVLHPARQKVALAELEARQSGNVLQAAVQQMIARRQGTVRPGEPPYRPQVRLLVRPDGLRAYYLAYPLLESLQVPITRQNLEREEEIKPGLFRP